MITLQAFLENTKPNESFEDMDCFLHNGLDSFPNRGEIDGVITITDNI